jgi:hypothetical protein
MFMKDRRFAAICSNPACIKAPVKSRYICPLFTAEGIKANLSAEKNPKICKMNTITQAALQKIVI